MIALLLLACMGPDLDAMAVETCEALPGVAVDGAGQAMMRELVVAEELALWKADASYGAAGYGPGIELPGLKGYGVLRANSRCELVSWDGDTAVLTRHEPDLDAIDEEFEPEAVEGLPKRQVTLRLQLVDGEQGPRFRVGVVQAREQLDRAVALVEIDPAAARAALDELAAWFPDPTLAWALPERPPAPEPPEPDLPPAAPGP